jgi:rSAM/selenodomain-associated transferase 2
MKLSIIIPTYNEAARIGPLLAYLFQHADGRLSEIIVSDGQSTDRTLALAREAGALTLRSPKRGRACQMNYAASLAKGDVLYFVHADTLPPSTYPGDIEAAYDEGYLLGGYCSAFENASPLFRINEWFTRLDGQISQGGDQTLFVEAGLFKKLRGYDESFVIMEDFDFIRRARELASFKKMNGRASISTRKYENNSYLKVTLANALVFGLYRMGVAPERLRKIYHKLIL